eukprot:gene2825-3080_t
MALRRSSREVKKRDFFTFANPANEEAFQDNPPKRNKRLSIKKSSSKEDRGSVTQEMMKESTLFGRVASTVKLGTEIDRWIDSYKAAGCVKDWIEEDVDLEALEPDEIDVLLADMIRTMSQTKGSKVYPLLQKGKRHTFRKHFQTFFSSLVEHARYLTATNGNGRKSVHFGQDLLRRVVDQLMAFSTMSIANIRDAFAEASLTIATSCVTICIDLQKAIQQADRLNTVETTKGNKTKQSAIMGQQESLKHELETYHDLVNTIFNTIYLHRSKDSHEEVRLTCLGHLPALLSFDPHKPIRVDFLKYLGWACYDYANQIRLNALESIRALVEQPELSAHLVAFVSHFLQRFFEMASGDVDSAVCLEALKTLRVMQRQGFLDSVPGDQLDLVDQIVFDPDAELAVREEALRFLMDHTEGFDDFDEESHLALLQKTPNGKKKKADTSSTDLKEALKLARSRNIATQLETLTEFAEYHLGSHLRWTSLLAEACLGTNKNYLLHEWPTMMALLSRDSENSDLISHALRPSQVSILLQLLSFSATALCDSVEDLKSKPANKKKMTTQEVNTLFTRYESLNQTLQSSLPTLLTRFQDDEENLILLSGLFPLCDLSVTHQSGDDDGEGGEVTLLSKLADFFERFSGENLLINISKAFSHCLDNNKDDKIRKGDLYNIAEKHLQEIGQRVTEKVVDQVQVLKERIEGMDISEEVKTKGRRRSRSSPTQKLVEESVSELSRLVEKLMVLWQTFDLRLFIDMTVEQVGSSLVEGVQAVSSLLVSSASFLTELLRTNCVRCCKSAFTTLLTLLLWLHRDILDLSRKNHSSSSKGSTGDEEIDHEEKEEEEEGVAKKTQQNKKKRKRKEESKINDDIAEKELTDQIEARIVHVVALRDQIVAIALNVMTSSLSVSPPLKDADLHTTREVQLAAYQAVTDICAFFPARLQTFQGFEQLAFLPSPPVLDALKKVFDIEGRRVEAQLAALEEEDTGSETFDSASALANHLVDDVLLPLSHSMIFDVSHVNRRQAAAVLLYLLHPNDQINAAVKAIARRLKEGDLTRYLEIQLIALRGIYLDEIKTHIQRRKQAIEDDDETFDFIASEQTITLGFEKLLNLAKRFANFFGVGKWQGEQLAVLSNFFQEGVLFALADPSHVGFVEALQPYLRFLSVGSKKVVGKVFTVALGRLSPTLREEVQKQLEEPNSEEYYALKSFHDAVGSHETNALMRKSPKKQTRTRTAKEEEGERTKTMESMIEQDFDIEPEEPTVEQGERKGKKEDVDKEESSSKRGSKRKPKGQSRGDSQSKRSRNSSDTPTSPVLPSRRSSRSTAQKEVSYVEDDEQHNDISDEEIEEEEEMPTNTSQSTRSSSRVKAKGEGKRRSSKKKEEKSEKEKKDEMFSLGLSIVDHSEEDDEEEKGEEEEDTTEKVTAPFLSRNAKTQAILDPNTPQFPFDTDLDSAPSIRKVYGNVHNNRRFL